MAGSGGEIERIISEIQQLFPNIRVTEDDIVNPNHEFVKKFCELALNYYDRKIGFIATTEETPLVNTAVSEFTNLGYGAELALFVRISRLTGKISGNTNFTFMDFCKLPKQRTKAFFRIILNFLLYVDNEVQDNQNIIEECLEKIKTSKELEDRGNALLEAINETVRGTAGKEDLINSLEAELVILNKEYDQMLEEKAKDAKINEQAFAEFQKYETIANEKNDLLARLTESKKDLQRRVVGPDEIESLAATAEQLKQEEIEIKDHNEEYATTAKDKQDDCEYFAEALHKTTGLDFSCFSVLNELKEQESKIKDLEQKCANLSAQIQALEKENVQANIKINHTREKKQQLMLQKGKLKDGLVKDINEQKIRCEMVSKEIQEAEQTYNLLKDTRRKQDQLMAEARAKKDLLISTFEEQYKRALKIENKEVTAFHQNFLDPIRKEFQFISKKVEK